MGDDVEQPPPTAPPLRRRQRHRPGHVVVLGLNLVIALGCFGGAAALVIGQNVLNNQQKTAALEPTATTGTGNTLAEPLVTTPNSSDTTGTGGTGSIATGDSVLDGATTTTVESFPIADPDAKNFLITGSDNNACPDAESTNPVDARGELGERSDTIMVMRVDPTTSRAAVLSFPRDLYVKIAGTNKKSRINSAYKINDPQRLIDTIALNFYIPIDHYIQIDFCAFKVLVDSVGGVSVPFEYPAMDRYTNLNVPEVGCYNFDGDSALAYVRSRHYKYLDPKTNTFKEDPASDYGRIARQQDFLRRAVAKVVSQGPFDIGVARGLIEVATKYVVTDPGLTLDRQLEFAGVLKNLNPDDIHTYQVEGVGKTISGAAVIDPRLGGDNMKAILAIFRGAAQLETAPEQVFDDTATTVFDSTTTTAIPTATTRPSGVTTTTSTTSTTVVETTTTLPEVSTDQKIRGIVPPAGVKC